MKSVGRHSTWIFYTGVLCFVASAIVCAMAFFVVARSREAQTWVGVPANLLHLELKGGRPTFLDLLKRHKTERTIANYEYQFEGVRYPSSSVALFSMIGLNGHSQRVIYNLINTAKLSAQGVTAFVNPKKPSEAVLNRDISNGAINMLYMFSAAFGVMGVWLIRMDRAAKDNIEDN